jgi:uncharacterized membrane protein
MEFITHFINALVNQSSPHTMTVHFPTALTGAALLALWRRSWVLDQVAFFNVALAAGSAMVAGMMAFATTSSGSMSRLRWSTSRYFPPSASLP